MNAPKLLLAAGALALVGACSRTENGDVVIKHPSDVSVTTTKDTVHMPRLSSKLDTVNTPYLSTRKETIIVNRPMMGVKKTEVKVPVVRRP